MSIEIEYKGETKTLNEHLFSEWMAANRRGDKEQFNLLNAAIATIQFQEREIARLDYKIAQLERSIDLATGVTKVG